jgi:flagellar hook protein FlgE
MKHTLGITIFIAVFTLAFFSCKKDVSTLDMGYAYFPDQVGHYVIYDVDSTYYDDFYSPVKIKKIKFQVKEKIQSVFTDNQNRPTLRLERYVKPYDSLVPYSAMAWTLRDVWMENKTTTTAEKVEENVRFVRLVFPVKNNQTWNANAQNSNEERDFSYEFVDMPLSVGKISFAQVLETRYDDGGGILTSREYRTEKYAREVGMIYRQEIVVESQPKSGATTLELQTFYAKPIMERITSGFQYTMTINSYGTE